MKKRYFLFITFLFAQIHLFGQVKFDFTQDEHDFGVLEEGQTVYFTFEFTNTGKDTILLKESSRDVRPGCSCTASEYTKTPIPPNAKGIIKAGFNSTGRLGSFNKTITVSQKGIPYKVLVIKGMVLKKNEISFVNNPKKLPQVELTKTSYAFVGIEKGKPLTYSFSIKNTGKDTLKFSDGFSACQCISFRILQTKSSGPINTITELLPGKTATIEVKYIPPSPQGLGDSISNDKLTIFTNDPKQAKIEFNLSSK